MKGYLLPNFHQALAQYGWIRTMKALHQELHISHVSKFQGHIRYVPTQESFLAPERPAEWIVRHAGLSCSRKCREVYTLTGDLREKTDEAQRRCQLLGSSPHQAI